MLRVTTDLTTKGFDQKETMLHVTTEPQHLDRVGLLGDFEQENSMDSGQEGNTDLHSVNDTVMVCVTTETRPLDRLGQLGEFEQHSCHGVCMCRTGSARTCKASCRS